MSDIVKRLRAEATDNRRYEVSGTLATEAADRIEQLEAEGDKARARGDTLRMALEDIAYPNPLHNDDDLMRIARAALEERT